MSSSITRDFIAIYVLDSVSSVEKPMLRRPLEIDVEPTFDVMTINVFLNETLRPCSPQKTLIVNKKYSAYRELPELILWEK